MHFPNLKDFVQILNIYSLLTHTDHIMLVNTMTGF